MMHSDDLADLHQALAQGWNLSATPQAALTREEVLDALARRVAFLIKHDYQRLVTAMYLLDISEKQFDDAVSGAGVEVSARRVAELIFDRERRKMESRRQYRRERSIDVPFEPGDENAL